MQAFYIWERANDSIAQQFMRIIHSDQETEDTQQRVKYALLIILNETQKLMLLGAIFISFRCFSDFLFAFFSMTSVRIFCGGSHRRTNLGCFIQSLCVFSIVLLLGNLIMIKPAMYDVVYLCLLVVIWFMGEIPSPRKIAYSREQRYKFKGKALLVVFLIQIISHYISVHYYNIMLWSMILLCVEVTIMYIKIKVRGGEQ